MRIPFKNIEHMYLSIRHAVYNAVMLKTKEIEGHVSLIDARIWQAFIA